MRPPHCPGTRARRAFLQSSLVGLWSVSLADVLRCEARYSAAPACARPDSTHCGGSWTRADVDTLDTFQQKALSILTSHAASKAFDLSAEPDRTSGLYHRPALPSNPDYS